ncbi:hypothetical protein K1719_035536 [Acacia pycnantha]|nr:hypothetical protein K1719_035536 [Acacia pycnantha]
MANFLFWNARGACGQYLLQNLKTVCKSSRPCFLVLSETKSDQDSQFSRLYKLGFDGFTFVLSVSRSGGLVAVWKKDQIDVVLVQKRDNFFISFTRFRGREFSLDYCVCHPSISPQVGPLARSYKFVSLNLGFLGCNWRL